MLIKGAASVLAGLVPSDEMRLAETGAPAVRRDGGARGNAGALYARGGEGGGRTAPSDGCPRSAHHPVRGLDAGPADGPVIAGARVPSARTPFKGLRRRNAPHGGPARIAAGGLGAGVPWPARDRAAPFAPRARLGSGRGLHAQHARLLLRATLRFRCPFGPILIGHQRPRGLFLLHINSLRARRRRPRSLRRAASRPMARLRAVPP